LVNELASFSSPVSPFGMATAPLPARRIGVGGQAASRAAGASDDEEAVFTGLGAVSRPVDDGPSTTLRPPRSGGVEGVGGGAEAGDVGDVTDEEEVEGDGDRSALSLRIQAAAERERARAPTSLLGSMSLSSLRHAPSVLAGGDGDEGGFGGFADDDDGGGGGGDEDDDDGEEELEGAAAGGGFSSREGGGPLLLRRRVGGRASPGDGAARHVRINAQPRVVIYTPKTAMSSDSEWSENEGEGDGDADADGSDSSPAPGGVAPLAAVTAAVASPGYRGKWAARVDAPSVSAKDSSPAVGVLAAPSAPAPPPAPFSLPSIRISIPGLPRDPAPLSVGLRIGGPLAHLASLPHSSSRAGLTAPTDWDVTSAVSGVDVTGQGHGDAAALGLPRPVSPASMLKLKQVQAFALLQAAAGAAAVRKKGPGVASTVQPSALSACIATVLPHEGPGSGEDSGADAAEVAARKLAIATAAAARGDAGHAGKPLWHLAHGAREGEGFHGMRGAGFATSKVDDAAADAAHVSSIAVSAGPASMLHLLRLRMGGAAGVLAVGGDDGSDDWAAGADAGSDSSTDDGCPGAPKARAPRAGLAGAGSGGDGADSDDSMGCGASAYPIPAAGRHRRGEDGAARTATGPNTLRCQHRQGCPSAPRRPTARRADLWRLRRHHTRGMATLSPATNIVVKMPSPPTHGPRCHHPPPLWRRYIWARRPSRRLARTGRLASAHATTGRL